MSDLFGRLAARALGWAPPVGPRVAGRFEGAAARAASEAPVETEATALRTEADTAALPRRASTDAQSRIPAEREEAPPSPRRGPAPLRPAATVPSVREATSHLEPAGRHGGRPLQGEGRAGDGVERKGNAPQDIGGVERTGSAAASVAGIERTKIDGPAVKGPRVARTERSGIQVRAEAMYPSARADRSDADPLHRLQSSDTSAPSASNAPERRALRAEAAPPPALVPRATLDAEAPPSSTAPAARRAAPTAPEATTAPAAATEPVIRVTIGRIEVRAAAPARPAAPAARPAAPRLGLEDVLRLRAEERT